MASVTLTPDSPDEEDVFSDEDNPYSGPYPEPAPSPVERGEDDNVLRNAAWWLTRLAKQGAGAWLFLGETDRRAMLDLAVRLDVASRLSPSLPLRDSRPRGGEEEHRLVARVTVAAAGRIEKLEDDLRSAHRDIADLRSSLATVSRDRDVWRDRAERLWKYRVYMERLPDDTPPAWEIAEKHE